MIDIQSYGHHCLKCGEKLAQSRPFCSESCRDDPGPATMGAAELRTIRDMLGLSYRQFSHVIGMRDSNGSVIHAYENGDTIIPGPTAMLVRILAQRAILRRELGITDMEGRKDRGGRPAGASSSDRVCEPQLLSACNRLPAPRGAWGAARSHSTRRRPARRACRPQSVAR